MYKESPAKKKIMLLYGICVLILLANIPIGYMYHEILGLAAILVAVFISFFQFSALMMTWRKTGVEVYEDRPYTTKLEWSGQLNPAVNGFVSGIIMLILVFGSVPVTDWEWLGAPPINPMVILWATNGILSMLTGVYALRSGYGKFFIWEPPEYRKGN
jgi:hypothetical protein